MREFLLQQQRRGGSSGSSGSGGGICGGALAHQRSGQRHRGAAAVAAAAMAAVAAVDSRQRCSSSGAGAAPSGRGSTEASFFSITSHQKNETPKFHVTCSFYSRESKLLLPPPPSQWCSTLPPHLHARSLALHGNQLKGRQSGMPPPPGSATTAADFLIVLPAAHLCAPRIKNDNHGIFPPPPTNHPPLQ